VVSYERGTPVGGEGRFLILEVMSEAWRLPLGADLL